MAITFVDSSTATVDGSATGSITINFPVGVLEGDVVIAAADTGGGNQNRNMQESSGTWTPVADLFADDNIASNLGVFLKVQTATPDSSITIELAVGTGQWSGIVMVFRGVDNTTPQDVAATTDSGANSPDAAPPAITTVTDGCEIVVIGGASENSGTVTFPANYVNTIDVPGTSNNNRTMAATLSQATAGTETPGIFDVSTVTTTDSWTAVTIALRPAADEAVTGTTAQTLPSVTQAATATETMAATAAQTLPGPTQAASGTTTSLASGTAAQTLPSVTQAATGTETMSGTAAQTLPLVTQAAQGTGSVEEAVPQRNRGGFGGRRIKRETHHKRGKTLRELFEPVPAVTVPELPEPAPIAAEPAVSPPPDVPRGTLAPDLSPLIEGLESLRAAIAAAALAQATEEDDAEVLMVAI